MSLKDCIRLFYDLLPRGLAWNREVESNTYKLVSGLSEEFCRVEERLDDLLREIDAFQTFELLEDFEKMLGLPDECLNDLELSFEDRRRLVIAALSAQGGSTMEYFENLLLILGYEVEINDYVIARSGRLRSGDRLDGNEQNALSGRLRSGDRIYNSGWQFWFRVHSPTAIVSYTRSGIMRSGDRLATYGNSKIECIIRKLKPAHTAVWFTYGT